MRDPFSSAADVEREVPLIWQEFSVGRVKDCDLLDTCFNDFLMPGNKGLKMGVAEGAPRETPELQMRPLF
jgi:hypothetical protein